MGRIGPSARLLPLLLAALYPGCECQETEFVELQATATLPENIIDFGEVPVGSGRTLTRVLRNEGTAALEIAAIAVEPDSGAFFVEVVPAPVAAQSSGEVRVTFRPEREASYEATASLDTNARQEPPSLRLLGRGVTPAIEVHPASIDFGAVALGASRVQVLRVLNLRSVDQEVWLALQDDGALHFAVDDGGEGRRTVPAGGEIRVDLHFIPRHGGRHGATLRVDSCGDGCGVQVQLQGRCEVPRIVVEPLLLDFGTLAPGASEQRSVTVRNLGFGDLQVERIEVVAGSQSFAVEPAFQAAIVPENTEVSVLVRCAPETSGTASGRLEIASSDPASPTGHVELVGRRQGAELLAVPDRLEFGIVRDAGPHTRHVVLVNRGDQPAQVLAGAVLGEAFESSLLPTWPLEVPGGGSAVLELSFSAGNPGTFFGRLSLHSDVAETPLLEVTLAGTRSDSACVLVPAVETVRFGNVMVGSSSWQNLMLRNEGSQSCTIQSLGFSPLHINDPAFTVEAPVTTVVDPGQQVQARTVFAPTESGPAKAAIQVRLEGGVMPPLLLGLVGSGARAGLTAAPPVLDFGTTTAGCGQAERIVAIGNIGQVEANLGFVRLEAPSTTAYRIVEGGWIGRLPPGMRHMIRVRFEPQQPGTHSGLLMVEDSDDVAGVVVPLNGLALAANTAHLTETFTVAGISKVDVLFVIDNSGSMLDNQDNLAANFDYFIRSADILGPSINYQIGVVTTDVADPQQSGRLVSTPRLMNRSTPDLTARFGDSVRVGATGSGWEQGLEAALLALSPPLIDDPIYNDGLLRSDAALALVVVSDEDDGSPQPVDAYVGFLLGLKAAQALPVLFNAVTGGVAGCSEGEVWADPAPRYDDAVRQTGGRWMNLCASDWGSELESLGASIFLSRGRFHLQGQPEAGSLSVRVDGTVLQPGQWSYDDASRTVILDPSVVPGPGAVVEVDYVVTC
ncbi:MAG: choice-of-anchor D domain-containing protein [Pseudomonadota bacterium]